jgi:hypothetical protein
MANWQSCRKRRLNELVIAVIRLGPHSRPSQVSATDHDTRGAQSVDISRTTDEAQADVAHGSCRNRRLIQPTTVGPPAIVPDTHPCAVFAGARFRRQPAQSRVCAMTLENQGVSSPGQWPSRTACGQTLAPNRADQAFDEWMRQRHAPARSLHLCFRFVYASAAPGWHRYEGPDKITTSRGRSGRVARRGNRLPPRRGTSEDERA